MGSCLRPRLRWAEARCPFMPLKRPCCLCVCVRVCARVYLLKTKRKLCSVLADSSACLRLLGGGIYFHIWWLIICFHAETLVLCKCMALGGARVPSAVVFFCHFSQAEMDTLGSLLDDEVKGQNSPLDTVSESRNKLKSAHSSCFLTK